MRFSIPGVGSTSAVRGGGILAGALVLAVSGVSAQMAKDDAPAKLLSRSVAVMEVIQADARIGTETITREVYDDNTIIIRGKSEMAFAAGVTWTQHSELILDEDSYFPRHFETRKTMLHSDREIVQWVKIDMVANVAIYSQSSNNNEHTRHIVVPSGTLFLETGLAHLAYPLLYWYDLATGGRQTMPVMDVWQSRVEDAVLHVAGTSTVEVLGSPTEATEYVLERGTVTMRYQLDGERRLVSASFGHISFSLISWTQDELPESD